jgi:hypothetical protein
MYIFCILSWKYVDLCAIRGSVSGCKLWVNLVRKICLKNTWRDEFFEVFCETAQRNTPTSTTKHFAFNFRFMDVFVIENRLSAIHDLSSFNPRATFFKKPLNKPFGPVQYTHGWPLTYCCRSNNMGVLSNLWISDRKSDSPHKQCMGVADSPNKRNVESLNHAMRSPSRLSALNNTRNRDSPPYFFQLLEQKYYKLPMQIQCLGGHRLSE